LPLDAQFKGYVKHIVQDIKIIISNTLFLREKYHSKSNGEIYLGPLPAGHEGEYGPNIKTWSLLLKNVCNMSEPNILKFLQNAGVEISKGTISNLLIKNKDQFHEEKSEIILAGIKSSDYQQTDHSYTRVNGENWFTQILCNPFYTAFFTTKRKTRLSVLEILLTGKENEGKGLKYKINEEALSILKELRLGIKYRRKLSNHLSDKEFTKEEIEKCLAAHIVKLTDRIKNKIMDACAIAVYHSQEDYPIIKTLLCDDAPEFKLITENLSLCWIHEGRHYKKLSPVITYNIDKTNEFINKFWSYYRKLLFYKARPSPELAEKLSLEFDILFTTYTGYEKLDERISKTLKKKNRLLLVLKYPHIPLHNNESELSARVVARKRDVSLHTISEDGTKANDTFLTLAETCRKLEVNFFNYIYDRITRKFKLKSLVELISEKCDLGISYTTT
jgi:hypothetical protein